jgi:Flp pilus assembly protein TadD
MYRSAHRLSANEDPPDPAPLIGLGRTLAKLGAQDEAVEAFRQALKMGADDPETRRLLGNSLLALGLPAAAMTQFAAASQSRPDARIHNGIGVANDMTGDHDAAQASYRAGLEMEPGNLNLRNNLGLSLAIVGKFDEAIELLRRTASDPRAGARQRNNLALAYGLAGRTEAAARINRIYQDDRATNGNISYYKTLRALRDTRQTVNVIGAHTAGASGVQHPSLPHRTAYQGNADTGSFRSKAAGASAPVEEEADRAPVSAGTRIRRRDASVEAVNPVATGRPAPLIRPQVAGRGASADQREPVADLPVGAERAGDGTSPGAGGKVIRLPGAARRPGKAVMVKRASGRYVVQFASYRTRERAKVGWEQIQRTASELLDGIRPDVQSVHVGPASLPYYRLRSQPLRDMAEAQSLCESLAFRRVECLVIEQPGTKGKSTNFEESETVKAGEHQHVAKEPGTNDARESFSP